MTDQPSQEPKLFSAELKSIRDEFKDIAARTTAAISRLDRAIWDAESKERRDDLDKTLNEFVPHNFDLLKGHDVTFIIAKTQGMGEGYNSPIGAAINVATRLNVAVGGHDTTINGGLLDTSTKWLRLSDYDRLDKAREKTANVTCDLLPAVKDIMISNTPDKATDRQKHYIIVTTGSVTDNLDFSAQMINTALQMNPKLTFDFVSFGDGSGNVKDLVAKINAPSEAQKPGNYTVAKPEDLHATVMCALTGRFSGKPAELKAAGPEVQAPQAAAPVVETPKVETPKAEAPKSEAPKAEAPAPATEAPKAEAPKTEVPPAAAVPAAAPAANENQPGRVKRFFKRFSRS